MEQSLLILSLDNRQVTALEVQKILTEAGCMIKTRIGLHSGILDQCSSRGVVILELVGEKQEHKKLLEKFAKLDNVKSQLVEI